MQAIQVRHAPSARKLLLVLFVALAIVLAGSAGYLARGLVGVPAVTATAKAPAAIGADKYPTTYGGGPTDQDALGQVEAPAPASNSSDDLRPAPTHGEIP